MTGSHSDGVRHVVPEDLTPDQIAEAREALFELAGTLARAAATASHELGIAFDMDDPQVAGDVITATFEALVYSRPPAPARQSRATRPPVSQAGL